MSLDKKKLGEQELKRALLMMKYDSRKTLSENTNDLILEQNNCPNSLDYQTIKTKAERVGDLVEYLNEPFTRMFYIEERAKEVYDTIKELSTKNFYVAQTNTCENSLKRFTMDFESYYSETFGFDESLEEELQDLINGHIGEVGGGEAKTNLQVALQLIIDNKDKLAGGTDQQDPQQDTVLQNAIDCGYTTVDEYKKGDGTGEWKCPKPGAKGCKYCPESGKSGGGTGGGSYKDCSGTYTKGCKSEVIRKVQGCLGGLTTDGKFGDNTQKALVAKDYLNGFTDKDVAVICNEVQPSPEAKPQTNSVNVELETGSNEVSDTSAF